MLNDRSVAASAAQPGAPESGWASTEQSHISDSHRLLEFTPARLRSLYGRAEYCKAAVALGASYFLDQLVPNLRALINRKVARRVTATVRRTRARANEYGVKRPGDAEYVTEALFDTTYFKLNERHVSRVELRDQVAALLREGTSIELVLPVLSRKPWSPLKNRGALPDLAEVASLAQLASAAQLVNAVSPGGCHVTVLADGHKYRRACDTLPASVSAYQEALHFWIEALGVKSRVHLLDYEAVVSSDLCGVDALAREQLYGEWVERLERLHEPCFDADDWVGSMARLSSSGSLGVQTAYTLRSLLTSYNYASLEALRELQTDTASCYGDIGQGLYGQHIAGLRSPLAESASTDAWAPTTCRRGRLRAFEAMRRAAWGAACRYVAISITDRELRVIRRCFPRALKLTIHAKPGEIQCVTTSRRDLSMVAQHCTGGIRFGNKGAELDFRYRVEREAEGQVPITVARDAELSAYPERYGPLLGMHATEQPFLYTNDVAALLEGDLVERSSAMDSP